MAKVLIIDDDSGMCYTLSRMVSMEGHDVDCAQSLKEGSAKSNSGSYDLVLLDVMMPDGSGLDLLPKIRNSPSRPEVIIMTAAGSAEGAEMAIISGAWDYLQKPFSMQELKLLLTRSMQYRSERISHESKPALRLDGIIGRSPEMMRCTEFVARAAFSDANVLITGETGTGKELFARAIHANSSRSKGRFVVIDCGSLPENLVESILFGHVKGAFTGADRDREGLVRQADKGTLFLDEVGELPLPIQKAFLRVIQERSFRPVGAKEESKADFRVIAATNRKLDSMVEEGQFRNDLLYRLRSIVFDLPPLRGRAADILDLVMHYMRTLCDRYGAGLKGISPEFLEAMLTYRWPGNVRELIHAMERAVSAGREAQTLHRYHLPAPIRVHMAASALGAKESLRGEDKTALPEGEIPAITLKETVETVEKRYLERLLASTDGSIKEACRISGLSRSRLYERLRKYGLQSRAERVK
jgi:two-component system, NtrC family, response regulator